MTSLERLVEVTTNFFVTGQVTAPSRVFPNTHPRALGRPGRLGPAPAPGACDYGTGS